MPLSPSEGLRAVHILYATTARLDEFDAPAYHVTLFAHALVELGHNVVLLHPASRNLVMPQYQEQFEHVSVFWPHVRGGWRLFTWCFARRLGRLARSGRFDCVYVRVAPAARILGALRDSIAPVAYELNGQEHLANEHIHRGADMFSLVFTDSNETIDAASSQWGVPSKRFVLNPNAGVDPAVFSGCVDAVSTQRRYGIDPERFVIAHASSFRRHHDFDTIIEAAAQVDFPVQLVFCGEGTRLPEIREKCHSHQLAARFLGALPQEKMADVLRTANVCVDALHAWSQRAGNLRAFKLYEYMAAGVPVIETIEPSLPVPDWARECLALVPFENPDAIAAALTNIHLKPQVWGKRAARSREWVLSYATWRHVAQRAADAIEGIIRSEGDT